MKALNIGENTDIINTNVNFETGTDIVTRFVEIGKK